MPYFRRADLKALEIYRRRSQASGNLVLLSFNILFEAVQVHKEKADLQGDERIRLCVDSPNNPEHITQSETYKSCHFGLLDVEIRLATLPAQLPSSRAIEPNQNWPNASPPAGLHS